jgi:hypothetical protein
MHGETDDVMKYRFTLNTGDQFDCSAFEEELGDGVKLFQASRRPERGFAVPQPTTIVVRMGYYYRAIPEYKHPYYEALSHEVDELEHSRTL